MVFLPTVPPPPLRLDALLGVSLIHQEGKSSREKLERYFTVESLQLQIKHEKYLTEHERKDSS